MDVNTGGQTKKRRGKENHVGLRTPIYVRAFVGIPSATLIIRRQRPSANLTIRRQGRKNRTPKNRVDSPPNQNRNNTMTVPRKPALAR
jgi:hypothetical protein